MSSTRFTDRRREPLQNPTPVQSRLQPGTAQRARGYDLQGLIAAIDNRADAEIFPHTGEQELFDGPEYGEEDIELQSRGGRDDGGYGGTAGAGGQVLFPGGEERCVEVLMLTV